MAKRSNNWDANKLDRWVKEGRGQGEGENYKPWLTIQDFPSKGRVTRILGWTTQRIHHFFLLDWEERVIDIREHYPLLDLDVVLENTSDLKLEKFTDKKTKEPYIFTTTFLITLINSVGKRNFAARSIKYASELSKKSTIEKLEIERRYWKERGVNWGIVTNKDINSVRAKNIEWVHTAMNFEGNDRLSKEEFSSLLDSILYRFVGNKLSIKEVISGFEMDYSLDVGTGLHLFKYLLADKRIVLDLDKPIKLNDTGVFYIPEIDSKGGYGNVRNDN